MIENDPADNPNSSQSIPDDESRSIEHIAASLAETFRSLETEVESHVPSPRVSPAPNDEMLDFVEAPIDARLYLPDHEDWEIHIKRDSERYFCYSKSPGQDWFHLILNGEIFLSRQHERYCLECALRMGFLTQDRLFWQHRVKKKPNRVL